MFTNLEYPIKVQGADGTTLWKGCGYVQNAEEFSNGEASTAFAVGEAAAWDLTNLRIQTPAATAAIKQAAPVKRAITTGNQDCFVGVAISPGGVGEKVVVATDGSVVPVKITATGTQQQNLIGSTTAGSVTPQDNLATGPNGTLGKLLVIGGTTGAPTDSGSSSYGIVAINIS